MLKNIDRTGAPGRALPIADRIGAVIRGAGFSLRIVQRKRVQRGDAKTDEHSGTRAEKHSEVGAPRGKDHINPAWHSLSRIASGLRAVLTDLRRSSTTTEATAPLQRPSSLDPARRPRPHPSSLQAQARQRMDNAELALARVRASVCALRHKRAHEGNWVVVLTPEIGDGPVPSAWISELNCQHFTVFDVEMLNDLVISAGSSIACIVLDGRLENRSMAELAIGEAKQRYPSIRAVLLDAGSRTGDDAAFQAPFDVRLGLPPTRARLRWAIVAGSVVSD